MKLFAKRTCISQLMRNAFYSLLLILVNIGIAHAGVADLTRHLADYERQAGPPNKTIDNFTASPGSATLIVTQIPNANKVTRASIRINGKRILGPRDFKKRSKKGAATLEVPIELTNDNQIAVRLAGKPGGAITVRVKQHVDVALNITGRIHFNTQVSNFAASKQFYQNLGFVGAFAFPPTNTLAVAEAIGIETPTRYDGSEGPEAGGYLLQVELIFLANFGGSFIDLIEFTIPRNDEPPYPHLYHLGMARAAMQTADIDADYNYMVSLGVEFLSPPTDRSNGQRFAIFKDPDGTFYELTEVASVPIPGAVTNIVSLGRVNINVTDFERSQAFYQMLDFVSGEALPPTDSLAVAQALGLNKKYRLKGELLAHTGDGSTIELVQWLKPIDLSPPYPLPVNHIGIHRMAYSTDDLSADVAALKAVGVKFLSEIAPCCEGPASASGIISFLDPDGTVLELVGPITPASP